MFERSMRSNIQTVQLPLTCKIFMMRPGPGGVLQGGTLNCAYIELCHNIKCLIVTDC